MEFVVIGIQDVYMHIALKQEKEMVDGNDDDAFRE